MEASFDKGPFCCKSPASTIVLAQNGICLVNLLKVNIMQISDNMVYIILADISL